MVVGIGTRKPAVRFGLGYGAWLVDIALIAASVNRHFTVPRLGALGDIAIELVMMGVDFYLILPKLGSRDPLVLRHALSGRIYDALRPPNG